MLGQRYWHAGKGFDKAWIFRVLSIALYRTMLCGFTDNITHYNFQVTPATHLTVDAQIIDSTVESVDTAFTLGARLQIDF